MTTKVKKLIMDKQALEKCIKRLSLEIVQKNKKVKNIIIIGMQTRGVLIARYLAKKLKAMENLDVPLGTLDVTLYRDDFRMAFKQPIVKVTDIPFSIEKKNIILVDDVLYTGRTVRAALDALTDFGRPKSIQLVELIDRGHHELPISADYIGEVVKTSVNEEIAVKVKEIDGEDAVYLMEITDRRRRH